MRTIISLLIAVTLVQAAATGAAFLRIPVDARVTGYGEAAGALSGGISALYYNPAGLAGNRSYGVLLSHNQWLLDMKHEYVGAGFGNEQLGTFGLSFNYLGSGSIQGVTWRGETIPGYWFSVSSWCLNLGYGRKLGPVALGLGAKYIAEHNESLSTSAFAGDVGVSYDTPLEGLRAGLAVTNFGTKLKLVQETFGLPLALRIGWRYDRSIFGICQDFILSSAEMPGIAAGVEVRPLEMFALRAGYRTGSDMDGLSGLRAGVGFLLSGFGVDYAFAPYGRLGTSHRLSLSYQGQSREFEE
jgi:hypothetical protein